LEKLVVLKGMFEGYLVPQFFKESQVKEWLTLMGYSADRFDHFLKTYTEEDLKSLREYLIALD